MGHDCYFKALRRENDPQITQITQISAYQIGCATERKKTAHLAAVEKLEATLGSGFSEADSQLRRS